MRPPSVASWLVAALMALALAGDTYRISIEVPDSLEIIQQMHTMPSVGAAFIEGLHSSPTMLRPLRQVQTKLLVDAGTALGGRYHLVYRGYHAVLVVALIGLFVLVARVRTWTDAAACAIALVVLTGTHTFGGMVREAYPVNHFLLISLYALAMLTLAFTRGGWLVDASALALFALATLTLESGVLLWAVAVAAYVGGLRGLSWRVLVGLTVLGVVYLVVREGILDMNFPVVGDRPTSVGVKELTRETQIARFGDNPLAFYIYNSATSVVSVLLSQPRAGRWTVVEAATRGHVAPVYVIEILSSIAATALIVRYCFLRDEQGRRRWREPIPLVFVSMLLANGIISYAYTKNEIISVSGVFYALAVYVALRHLLSRVQPDVVGLAVTSAILVFSAGWSMRAAGLHVAMLRAAFNARTEWAGVLMPSGQSDWPAAPDALELTMQLKREAIANRGVPSGALPRWTREWWGEE